MLADVQTGGVDPCRRALAESGRSQGAQQHRRPWQPCLDERADPGQVDRTVWPYQRRSIDHPDKRYVHRCRRRLCPKRTQVGHRHPHDSRCMGSGRFRSRRRFAFDDGLHPSKVLIQGAVHPPGQRWRQEANDPVRSQLCAHGQPAAAGDVLDLAMTASIECLRPAYGGP
jgi:hypothetical protein